MSELINNIG